MSRPISVAIACVLLSGCTVPRGAMPAAPSYYDLLNDGTPQRQEEIKRKYLVSTDGAGVHVGEAVRTRGRVDGPLPTEWSAVHPDVQGYLSSDREAAAQLPSTWLFMASGSGVVLGGLATIAVPLLAIGAGVAATAFLIGGKPKFAGPWNSVNSDQLPAVGAGLSLGLGALGMVLSAVVAVPLLLAGGAGLWFVDRKVQEAQAAFNRNLEKRISEATSASPGAPAVVAPAAPPVATPPPVEKPAAAP